MGSAYSVQATLNGATARDWSLGSGPAWLGVSTTGLVTGTPPAGTSSFGYVLQGTDASGRVSQLRVDVAVSPALNAIAVTFPSESYAFQVGKAGSIVPSVSSESGAQAWKFTSAKPAPLSIDAATGRITSAASASTLGPVRVDVSVSDASESASSGFTYSVLPNLSLSYASTVFPMGRAFSLSPSTTAAPGSVFSGPEGRPEYGFYNLRLNASTGAISGIANVLSFGRETTVTVTEPDGSTLTSAKFVYSVQPPVASSQFGSGASLYGGGTDILQVLGLAAEGNGVTLPPGGDVTILYDGTYNIQYVFLSAGPTALKARIDYRDTGGGWRPTMWDGTFTLNANSGSGTGVNQDVNQGIVYPATGIRVVSTGTATGQVDRITVSAGG